MADAKLKFTKIRYDGKLETVELDYDRKTGDITEPVRGMKGGAPVPKFVDTLRAFKVPMLTLLQLPGDYGENMEVNQISISYPNDSRGIVIVAKKPLPGCNSPLVLHSPYLPEPSEAGKSGMTDEMIELLEELEGLAIAYVVEGERAQQELELANGGKPKLHQGDIEEAAVTGPSADVLRESARALEQIILKQFPRETFEGSELNDGAIAGGLLDAFGDVEYVDEEDREHPKWSHILKHRETVDLGNMTGGTVTMTKRVVWCAVRTDGASPRFWYDINPEQFDSAAQAATLMGAPLFQLVRDIVGIKEPEAKPELPKPGDKLKSKENMRFTWLVVNATSERTSIESMDQTKRAFVRTEDLTRQGVYWVAEKLFSETDAQASSNDVENQEVAEAATA
jgi:hypothetical protein